MKKYILLSIIGLFGFVGIVTAHSSISPSQTATNKNETFTLSVPTEKQVPTIGIRLVLPEGIDRVRPFVKAGWTISMTKDGDKVTQVEWKDGSIPADQKDVFLFSARTGAEDTSLVWKVYQTYQGGEVVAWDQQPGEGVSTPYSVTEVKAASETTSAKEKSKLVENLPFLISLAALAVSLAALTLSRKK